MRLRDRTRFSSCAVLRHQLMETVEIAVIVERDPSGPMTSAPYHRDAAAHVLDLAG